MVLRRPKAGSFSDPAGLNDFVEGCRVELVVEGWDENGTVVAVGEDHVMVNRDKNAPDGHECPKENLSRIGYWR